MRRPRPPTWHALAAFAIVLGAFALRVAGVDRELPHRPEPDSYYVQAFQEYEGDPAIVRNTSYRWRYPSLVPRLLALLPFPERPARASGPGSEAVHLAAAAWPYARVRTAIALLSTLGVLLTWFLARRLLSPAAALLASAFLATSLLSLIFAQQGRPHTAQAVMALATVVAALRVLDRPSAARIALAVLAGAFAAASLQSGLVALAPVLAAVYLARREVSPGRGRLAPFALGAFAAGTAAAIALPFYPGLPRLDASGIQLGWPDGGAHHLEFRLADGLSLAGLRHATRVVWAHDPVLVALGLAGILLGAISWARRPGAAAPAGSARRRELLVVGAYVVPYLLILAPNPRVYERFLLPMLPFLAMAAGWLAAAVLARVRGPARALVPAAFLAGPAYLALRYVQVARAPDQLERAAEWVRAHVDPHSLLVASPGTVLPLLQDPESVRIDLEDAGIYTLPWLAYQGTLTDEQDPARRWRVQIFPSGLATGPGKLPPDEIEPWLRAAQADYVVMETSRTMRNLPAAAALEKAAQKIGERVYHASGQLTSMPGQGSHGEYQGANDFARWLLGAEAFGPGVDVYRIRRAELRATTAR